MGEKTGREKAIDVLGYMADRFEDGKHYFKSRQIVDALPYSSKEIGASMALVDDAYSDASSDDDTLKWGRDKASTWYMAPVFEDEQLYSEVRRTLANPG